MRTGVTVESHAKEREAMRFNRIWCSTLLLTMYVCGNVQAQHAHHHGGVDQPPMSFKQRFQYDMYRNQRWPMPFRNLDTAAVSAFLDVQRNNGWRLSNTVVNAMFDPATQSLTDAGKSHVRWIVTQAPRHRRIVFVLEGNNQQETADRVESTQLAISEIVPVGPLPEIYLTNREPRGMSGEYQTTILRAMNASVPKPRLPSGSGGGSSSLGQSGGNNSN
jgi:hypothetical protein